MANGAKVATDRKRKGDDKSKVAKSQLKSNEAAKTVKCKVCFQDFQGTVKQPELQKHVDGKHAGKKTYEDCFPA